MNKIKEKFSSFLFFLSIILFILAFNFSDNPVGNWYLQFMPYPSGGSIRDVTFVDSLLGFAVSDSSILKTINGGDNWAVKLSGYYIFERIQFLNANTGFACGGNNKLLKTTNSGENWTIMTPSSIYPFDMSVISEDTIWLVDNNSLVGGVFRTTNGGVNWTWQLNLGASNPDHIYMYNGRIGFIGEYGGTYLRKTTDSGASWFIVDSGGFNGFRDMFFVDSLTGWRSIGFMKKTTDGGLNWITQTLPSGGNIISSFMGRFSVLNRDTVWGVGGVALIGSTSRGIIYRTTNGGNNWLFQIPDTSVNPYAPFDFIRFVSRNSGWAYYNAISGIHTTTGGDPIWYTAIQQISGELPKDFILYQNYPNPFNSNTKFKVLIASNVKRQTSDVKVKVYDITGREVSIVLDKKLAPGKYEITFDGRELPSGVYFYSLVVEGSLIDTKKMILLK